MSVLCDFISPLVLWIFFDIISFFSDKKTCFFTFEYFSSVFGNGIIFFKSLEEVISSGEVSQGSIVLGIFNETSAEMGNTFCDLVTEG
jgi:hypothetical protein